ncbi:MAG: hypothetical protein FD166_3758 [Bacteroidetes bacterium]|nr:MAG: hypothetical protein FD166_3758 [Bacteroidota bacterium]
MPAIKLNYEQTAALFRLIAAQHKEINSFVEVDLQQIKEVVKSSAQLPALLYSSFSESFSGSRADNNQSRKRIFFGVIDSSSTKSKTNRSPHSIIDACRLLALDVASYLRNEARNNRLPGFDSDSLADGDMIYMKDDNFFGWEFSVEISTPVNLSFNADKWEV